MGAGLALAIRNKWPIVYQDYMAAYRNTQLVLGAVIMSVINPNSLFVANLCGQDRYGRDKRYTDYNAVSQCLSKLANFGREDLPIYIPKCMGSSLAGGNWHIVNALIEKILPNAIIVNNN